MDERKEKHCPCGRVLTDDDRDAHVVNAAEDIVCAECAAEPSEEAWRRMEAKLAWGEQWGLV